MEHPGFFERAGPFSLEDVAKATGAQLAPGSAAAGTMIEDVRTLTDAGPRDLTFFNNRKYADRLKATIAGACLVLPTFAERVPPTTGRLVTPDPYRGFAQALMLFYPASRHMQAAPGGDPIYYVGLPTVYPAAGLAIVTLVLVSLATKPPSEEEVAALR